MLRRPGQDDGCRSPDRQGQADEVRPAGAGPGRQVRLLEGQAEIGPGEAAEGDSGQRLGSRRALVGQPWDEGPGGQLPGADAVAAGQGNGQRLHGERATGPRPRIGREPAGKVRRDDEWPRADQDDRP